MGTAAGAKIARAKKAEMHRRRVALLEYEPDMSDAANNMPECPNVRMPECPSVRWRIPLRFEFLFKYPKAQMQNKMSKCQNAKVSKCATV